MGGRLGGHAIFWGGTGSSLLCVFSIPQFPYGGAPGGGAPDPYGGARAPPRAPSLSYATGNKSKPRKYCVTLFCVFFVFLFFFYNSKLVLCCQEFNRN